MAKTRKVSVTFKKSVKVLLKVKKTKAPSYAILSITNAICLTYAPVKKAWFTLRVGDRITEACAEMLAAKYEVTVT